MNQSSDIMKRSQKIAQRKRNIIHKVHSAQTYLLVYEYDGFLKTEN